MSGKAWEAAGGRRAFGTPGGLLAAYGAVALATAVAVAVGGTTRTGLALGVLAATTFVVAARTTRLAALGGAVMAWLFYDGFVIGRHAQLAWHGAADVRRLVILAGAAAAGLALPALAARLGARQRAGARLADPPWAAHVISLADARAARRGLRPAPPDVRNY